MIKLDRSKVQEPINLAKPSQKVKEEREKAIALFAKGRDNEEGIEDERKKFKFDAYRDDSIKEALKKLSDNKCAYCESKFLHVYYGDIEHFRPKKKVGSGSNFESPGYYWMATQWDNLLLSCLFCNQAKKQETLEDGEITIGKQNQFPLDDNDQYTRRREYNDGVDEKRLLIDPCLEDPETLLAYDEKGTIYPSKDDSTYEFRLAETSIHVFALQRLPLVLERKAKWIEVQAQIVRVKEYIQTLNDEIIGGATDLQMRFNLILNRELEILKKMTKSDQQYAGLARQEINNFLREIGIEV
ncbi:MAG: retron system putative HNH endonuclease [Crocinitomicaceae bacterium]